MPETALLIIDMQVVLVKGAHQASEVLARIAQVAERCRATGIPVVYLQHNHATFAPMMKGEPGWAIHSKIEPQSVDLVVEKEASDAFYRTTLAESLRERNVQRLLLTGMATEYCVDATARSALSQGFDVVLLADCHTTGDKTLSADAIIQHHNSLLANLAHPHHTIRVVKSTELQAEELELI